MSGEVVTSPEIAPPGGPFSPAILSPPGRVLWISGQVAQAADGTVVGGEDAGEQARQCLRNIDALLTSAGAARTDVVKVGVYLTDMADRAAVARARVEYFGDHKPAATLFQVAALVSPELKVEIEAVAVF